MISFVLLNWNSRGFLHRCIESLRQQTSTDLELIVVDNGSTNESLAYVRRLAAEGFARELIELPENRGFAAGMNAGIARARGELVVPLNSDVCLARNYVAALHACARRMAAADGNGAGDARGRAGSGGAEPIGMLAVPSYVWRWSDDSDELTDTLFTVGVSLVRRMSVSAWHPALDPMERLFGPEGPAPVYTAAALAAARADAGHVFDEAYGSFSEDIDLMLRLRALGYRCGTCLETAYWHVGSASLDGLLDYNRKPAAVQGMVQLNRLRNYARAQVSGRAVRVLPWLVLEDLYRVAAAERKAEAVRMLLRSYRQLPGLLRGRRYRGAAPSFGGTLHSDTARRRARGGLPPLPLDLENLKPARA